MKCDSKFCKPTVAVSGGFDLLHKGHCSLIQDAAKFGELIVILNSDDWLIRKKGYKVMSWMDRAFVLLSLKGVKDVIDVDDADGTVCEALQRIRPDYFANGGDRTSENTPELKLCTDLGIKPIFNVGGEKISSSSDLVRGAAQFFDF